MPNSSKMQKREKYLLEIIYSSVFDRRRLKSSCFVVQAVPLTDISFSPVSFVVERFVFDLESLGFFAEHSAAACDAYFDFIAFFVESKNDLLKRFSAAVVIRLFFFVLQKSRDRTFVQYAVAEKSLFFG